MKFDGARLDIIRITDIYRNIEIVFRNGPLALDSGFFFSLHIGTELIGKSWLKSQFSPILGKETESVVTVYIEATQSYWINFLCNIS